MPARPSRLFAAASTIYRVKSTAPLLKAASTRSWWKRPVPTTRRLIAESLVFDNDIAHLDTIVTVVDAESFSRDYASTDALSERGLASDEQSDEQMTARSWKC